MGVNEGLVCWKCGAAITTDGRFSRLETCRQCAAELHVCLMCSFHDPRHAEACREERAEAPSAKDRANFCDYFQPRPHAFSGHRADANAAARVQLEALFGGSAPTSNSEPDEARRALDALFKEPR